MNIDITSFISSIIGLCGVVLTAIVIPSLKERLGAERTEKALKWIKIAVAAAEQIYDATEGARKKQYVLESLSLRGITLDDVSIDQAIEAAVLELHKTIEA